MIGTVPDILARIASHKREQLPGKLARRTELEKKAAEATPDRRDFAGALTIQPPAIIAEIKQASPSKGLLTSDFQPGRTAREYFAGGAAALSVLTDENYFQGSLANLAEARDAVSLPVLRKDFTIDEIDVIEAASARADAILLIAALLSASEMRRFRELAESYRMAALVEVHDGDELEEAKDSGARIIGVNNRDLRTFSVSLETALHLAPAIPAGVIRVAESGIHQPSDLDTLRQAGFQAFLVGEHLMKSSDPAQALRGLRRQ
jgi:indole-3-glycerol phosphate synthase